MLLKNKALLVIFLTTFIDLVGVGLVIPILPLYVKDIGGSDAEVGMLIGIFSLMQFIFGSFWGGLSDRYGRKPILIISASIMAMSYVMFAFADTVWILFLSRALSGFGAANLGVAQAYISDITPPEERARSFAFIGAAFGLGFIFGPAIGGYVDDHYGFAAVGYTAATFSVFNVLLIALVLRESLKEKNTTGKLIKDPFSDLYKGLKKPIVGELIAINIIFVVAFAMMQGTAALLWNEEYGLGKKEVGWMFTYIGALATIIQGGLIGRIAKWLGERKMLVIGNILLAVGLFFMSSVPKDWFIPLELILMAILSLGMAFVNPTIGSMISYSTEKHEQGRVLGTNQSAGSLARTIGPVAGGFLYDISHHIPYFVGGTIMIGTCFLSYRLVKKIKI